MKKTFNKVIKTKTISPEDLGNLWKFINLPENHDKYYLSNETKEDRIGKYRILVTNPYDAENLKNIKLYEKKDDKDIISYKLQYYDILREEAGNTKKAMQLYALQKSIEYAYNKELKIDDKTGEFKELRELLQKVKKARSYYTLKVFLNDNKSSTTKKSSKSSAKPTKKKKKTSKPDGRGHE